MEYIVSKGGGSLEKYEPKKYYGGREDWEERFKEDQTRDFLGIIVIDGYIWSSSDIKRDDPLLIEAVNILGREANTRFSALKVVEIPDGIEWVIDEYDGAESVEEAHQSWS